MRARFRLNLVLLSVVAALGTLAYMETENEKHPARLAEVSADGISSVEIRRRRNGVIRFKKRDNRWYLVEPVKAPADPSRMEAILAIPRLPSNARYPLPDGDLAQFGLEQPQVSLTVNDLRLDIGDTDPVGRRRYVRQGGSLHLAEDIFLHYLIGPVEDYAADDPLPAVTALRDR